jgi:hypothetical protein
MLPANSQFLRPMATGRMARSTSLLSMGTLAPQPDAAFGIEIRVVRFALAAADVAADLVRGSSVAAVAVAANAVPAVLQLLGVEAVEQPREPLGAILDAHDVGVGRGPRKRAAIESLARGGPIAPHARFSHPGKAALGSAGRREAGRAFIRRVSPAGDWSKWRFAPTR